MYWEDRLRRELWKPSAEGIAGVNHLIADLDPTGLSSAATYLSNTKDKLFTVRKPREQGIAPELVIVATGPV